MSNNRESVLRVVQSQSDASDDPNHHVFAVDSALAQFSDDQYYEIESRLRSLEVDSGTSLPLYNMFGLNITSNRSSSELLSLPQYIYLVKRLKTEINQNKIDTVLMEDVSSSVEPLLLDLNRNVDVAVENKPEFRAYHRLVNKIKSFFWTLPILLDQLLAVVTSRAETETVETIFVPSGSRFRSMKPVLEEMSTDYAVVLNQAVISNRLRDFANKSIQEFNPTLVHQYASLRTVLTQTRYLLFEYIPNELVRDTTEKELVRAINEEFSAQLDTTVAHSFQSLYDHRSTNSILSYFTYKKAIEKTRADSVVVGTGYGATSEAIWLAAHDSNVDAYDLPHTITLDPPQTGYFTDYTFVTGKFAKEYIHSNQPDKSDDTKILPTGRPYFEQLNMYTTCQRAEITEPIRIVIATQPFKYKICAEFIQESIRSLQLLPATTEITIKLHPSESKERYENLDLPNSEYTIKDNSLWEELESADVVLSINSNVGLEAIIADAITVVVNLQIFEDKRSLPYSKDGPVPTLTSQKEMDAFFESLTLDEMDGLKQKQHRFITNEYVINDAAARVASELEN